ncbi:MAG: YihY/virulence factor BrkB family protein [Ruminococcus sp.]|nr:YihY/virulence factor BrkB family protein [Ruminococcus sp.]
MINQIKKYYDIFTPFIKKISGDNVFAIAGQSAFFLLLSAVPLAMFMVSMMQNLHIPFDVVDNALGKIFTGQVISEISSFLSDAYQSAVGISIVTIAVTLWSAAKGVHAVINGMNRICGTYENRNWLLLRIRAMIYTVVLLVIIAATLLIVVLGSTINGWLSPYLRYLPKIVENVFHLRYIIVFVYLTVLFALVYRNLPNLCKSERRKYGFMFHLPGAVLCAASWIVLSLGISIYVDDFNGFSLYGGLARIAVIMVWLYFCMVCLMLGAEINYYYHDKIKAIFFWLVKRRKAKKKKEINYKA